MPTKAIERLPGPAGRAATDRERDKNKRPAVWAEAEAPLPDRSRWLRSSYSSLLGVTRTVDATERPHAAEGSTIAGRGGERHDPLGFAFRDHKSALG
jgi:hypothetical protein